MKCLGSTTSGISRNFLKIFYEPHIKRLPIYSSAAPSNLAEIAVVHDNAARLITEAWKKSPIQALYVEGRVLPPDLQKKVTSANFLAKLLSTPKDHPIHNLYDKDSWLNSTILRGKQYKTPLCYRAKNSLIARDHTSKCDLLKPASKLQVSLGIILKTIYSQIN